MSKSNAIADNRGKGRPARIDKAQIVDAALAVGLGRLTMKAVAERLGVGTAALYYHVKSRDEVMALVAEMLVAGATLPLGGAAADWRAGLRRTAHGLRAMFRSADGLAEYAFCDPSMPGEILKLHELGAAALVAAGFAPRTAWLALRSVADFVEAAVFREQKHQAAGGMENALSAEIAAIGPDRFPTLCQAFAQPPASSADEMFDYGLDCLLDGIAGRISPADSAP